jgi:hypothetical protein
MPAEIDSAVRPCAACGHAATLHSNEACEAIRCVCRVTQKMLAAAIPRAPVPAAVAVRRPAKSKKKRRTLARDETQAA